MALQLLTVLLNRGVNKQYYTLDGLGGNISHHIVERIAAAVIDSLESARDHTYKLPCCTSNAIDYKGGVQTYLEGFLSALLAI